MRWNKRFDGTKESLIDRSHKPKTKHPKSHTNHEINWIKNCIRRNPNATLIEIFYKLKSNYTVIDEPSRERFIYPFKEHPSHSTVTFLKMAIKHFGYNPNIIQTDNGFEFTHFRETKQVHPLDRLCQELGIEHKCIRPRTPRHNGKVERSHRKDNQRFYQHLTFYSYDDLIRQLKRYLYTSNRLLMQTLGWKSPIDMRKILSGASS